MNILKVEQPLAVFKKLPSPLDRIEIPERAENRKPTDKKFLYAFAVVIILLFPFLIYCLAKGDLSRWKGYDQCGNVCGQKNSKYEAWSCTGQDYTDSPYLDIDASFKETRGDDGLILISRRCVARCSSGYTDVFSSCYQLTSSSSSNIYGRNYDSRFRRDADVEGSNGIGSDISKYLIKHAWRIVLACFASFGVGIIMLVLFKTATAVVVWGILGGVLLFGAILIGTTWGFYLSPPVDKDTSSAQVYTTMYLVLAICFMVVWLVLVLVMIFMFKKIQLVILLLNETTKAVFAMPLLIFVPMISSCARLIILILVVFFHFYISTAGTLTELMSGYFYYKQNIIIDITFFFNSFVAYWCIQFISGIQYMVIAGAVAKWYWSKNKNNLESPIKESVSIVYKFHLGSIAFGSLVITLIAIIRSLLTSLTQSKSFKILVDLCAGSIESFLKFLSKNSYIITAMHGKPFYKSGKRAAQIIFQNAVNIATVNFVGDFVLGMAQLLIVLISLLITVVIMLGAESDYSFLVYLIVFSVSLLISLTLFATFGTTIDTLFLCSCEDSLLNDGMARPYAMSRDLMMFIESSKKSFRSKAI
ncbi:unnamed protein product [Psylliodes chrysocephalus]|uniref:Choline transporter-like protein n=1 Tax=Psylliodes chrysocephalus TaxID=3402493 RepID=A0A9P0D0Q6_9CUCU|nr:unnamed protein product [Psylliodes chrysocephala]